MPTSMVSRLLNPAFVTRSFRRWNASLMRMYDPTCLTLARRSSGRFTTSTFMWQSPQDKCPSLGRFLFGGLAGSGAQSLTICRCGIESVWSDVQHERVPTLGSELLADRDGRARFGGCELYFNELG